MISVQCPHCGGLNTIEEGFQGSTLTCSNPECELLFDLGTSQTLERIGGGFRRPSSGHNPILLDRIPLSIFGSATVYPIGLAIALLYGLVLFGILSSRKSEREAIAANRTEEASSSTEITPTPIAVPSKSYPKPSVEVGKSDATPSPTVAAKEEAKPADVPKSIPLAAAPVSTASPSPTTDPSAPVEPSRLVTAWGPLDGSKTLFDCLAKINGSGLVLEIPGSLHLLSKEVDSHNAPRLSTAVKGDFDVAVRVRGEVSPGTDPLPNTPLTYQGAGLLLYVDDGNYLRFERSKLVSAGGKEQGLIIDSCWEGKPAKGHNRDVRDADLSLKIERRGTKLRFWYMIDGPKWIDFKTLALNKLPETLNVGITAANVSPKPFRPSFENFELSDPSAKSAKGP